MGVADLERIEGPLHQIEPAGDRVVALGQFESASDTQVAVLREYSKHVRVQVRVSISVAWQRHGETYESLSVERADNLAADALRYDKDTSGDDVAVAITPNFRLQNDATLEVFEAGERLDMDFGLRAFTHDVGGSLAAFFARFHSMSSSDGV